MTRFPLLLSLMGAIAIRCNGRRQELHLAGQTRQLFTFLAAHVNQAKQRDCILDAIWPDAPRSRAISAMNTAVWRIKKVVTGYEGFSFVCMDSMIRLTVEHPASVDAAILERVVSEITACPSDSSQLNDQLKEELVAVVKECRGEFLDGCSEYWVLSLREHFGSLYIRALNFLMRDEAARNNLETALSYGRQILSLDPFRESTQREVMWLYAINGQRARAIQQFNELKSILNQELGLEPTSDTCMLLDRITAPEGPVPSGTQSTTLHSPSY